MLVPVKLIINDSYTAFFYANINIYLLQMLVLLLSDGVYIHIISFHLIVVKNVCFVFLLLFMLLLYWYVINLDI